MPTTIDSAGIIFNDASTITSANTFITKPASPINGQVLGYNGSTWTGTSLSASPTSAKAWVTFGGTGSGGFMAIFQSYNVSSVTDSGIGRYVVNLSITMPNANYAVVSTPGDNYLAAGGPPAMSLYFTPTTMTTTSFYLKSQQSSTTEADREYISAIVF